MYGLIIFFIVFGFCLELVIDFGLSFLWIIGIKFIKCLNLC